MRKACHQKENSGDQYDDFEEFLLEGWKEECVLGEQLNRTNMQNQTSQKMYKISKKINSNGDRWASKNKFSIEGELKHRSGNQERSKSQISDFDLLKIQAEHLDKSDGQYVNKLPNFSKELSIRIKRTNCDDDTLDERKFHSMSRAKRKRNFRAMSYKSQQSHCSFKEEIEANEKQLILKKQDKLGNCELKETSKSRKIKIENDIIASFYLNKQKIESRTALNLQNVLLKNKKRSENRKEVKTFRHKVEGRKINKIFPTSLKNKGTID